MRTIPDGVYEAESIMDDDGVVLGKHIPVRVRVEVRGAAITFDLRGVGAQVAGYFKGQALSSKGRYAIRFTISSESSTVQTTSRSNTYFPIVATSWHLALGEG